MILLTRFHGGERFAVNHDLIERIESRRHPTPSSP
jgi:uncharacterized protein YlzI (FlbEa/FlbD family)